MRPIKFRGFNTHDKKWFYGNLTQYDNGSCCINDIAVAPETVGQFTGLVDKNRQEIYEGDLLIEPSVATISLEVRFNKNQGSFCLVEHTHTEGPLLGTCPLGEMLRHYPTMKVVGNIHDNPEMVKGGKNNGYL